jgi:hypothetical protein
MTRGIDKKDKDIFIDDHDRSEFVARLSHLLVKTAPALISGAISVISAIDSAVLPPGIWWAFLVLLCIGMSSCSPSPDTLHLRAFWVKKYSTKISVGGESAILEIIRLPDGLFRKYRFICINGELLPYHLAIHEDWKVHHFHTDMAEHEWMRLEEESFLKFPHLVFDRHHPAVLRLVAASTELDYCGIDCALDVQGNCVVFETNAAMLVHDEKDKIFVYKNPYIARIKTAFEEKLRIMAGRTDP